MGCDLVVASLPGSCKTSSIVSSACKNSSFNKDSLSSDTKGFNKAAPFGVLLERFCLDKAMPSLLNSCSCLYIFINAGLLDHNQFIYCANNPVNNCDPTGHFLVPIIIVALVVYAIYTVYTAVKKAVKIANYVNNYENDVTDGYINDQNGETGQTLDYGLFDQEFNGCEIIAVHNAIEYVDEEETNSMAELTQDFQECDAMIGLGIAGSNVYKIGDVLEMHDISYEIVDLNHMDRKGMYIISFWNAANVPWGGIHTVATLYNGVNQYITYNLDGMGQRSYINPKDYARYYARYYVYGYYIKN